MKKYLLPLIAVVIAIILVIAALVYRSRPLSAEFKTYLHKVYPLSNKKNLDRRFFNSLHFYWYDPQSTAIFFKHVATKLDNNSTARFVCLSWMVDCVPKGPDNGVVRNRYPKGVSTPDLGGVPSNHLIEVYHNGWYQEPGLYFYALKGTGTFLDVGKTLIARNKVDALHKLGLTDSQTLQVFGYYIDNKGNYLPTFDYISDYADKHDMPFTQALAVLMKRSRDGDGYPSDRFNATASNDYALYKLARSKGYDTVQFTNQANTNGDWGYEIVDLRAKLDDSLKERWIKERKHLFIADPFHPEKRQPCQLAVPFKMVRCGQIQLGAAKN
jgi:hypothetical protein